MKTYRNLIRASVIGCIGIACAIAVWWIKSDTKQGKLVSSIAINRRQTDGTDPGTDRDAADKRRRTSRTGGSDESLPDGSAVAAKGEVGAADAGSAPTGALKSGKAVRAADLHRNISLQVKAGSGSLQSAVLLARQTTERSLGLFFKTTAVDDATREKLLQAVTNSQLEDDDIKQLGRDQGLSWAEINKLRDDQNRQFNQGILDLLGQDQGQYFINSLNASRFDSIAEGFAATCAEQGAPLTPAVINAIAINFSNNLRNPSFPNLDPVLPNGLTFGDNAAIKQAAIVLTPDQLSIFKKVIAEHPYPKMP